jgi:hypothetical protein
MLIKMKNKFLKLYIRKILLVSMTLPFQVLAVHDASRDHLCLNLSIGDIYQNICKRSFLRSLFGNGPVVNPLSKEQKKELCSYKPEEINLIRKEYHNLPMKRDHCLYLLQLKKDPNKIFKFETLRLS